MAKDIDKIDLKLLAALDLNPRASFKGLGRAARVSKEVAQYRFKQLVKNKIITGFFAYINVSKLGRRPHKILIKYKSVTKEIQQQIKKYLINNKDVSWAGVCEGAWDLVVTCLTKTSNDFTIFFNEFFTKFGKYFAKKQLILSNKAIALNDKYLCEGKTLLKSPVNFDLPTEKIDDIDKKILLELSANARKSFTEIGKKVNLSYWAVSQRYKQLIKKGIIFMLKPRIDFKKLGYSYYHFMIELNDQSIKQEIINYFSEHSYCNFIMEYVGTYELHVEFVLKKEKITDVIMNFREKFGNKIASYELLEIVEEYLINLMKKI